MEVIATLQAISSSGLTVALDDFGTGFSALNHLRLMPVEMLKIDSSYTADLGVDASTTAIIESISDLSRRLGIELVVEGIESDEQHEILRSMGVGLGQGYRLGGPYNEASFFAQLPELLTMTSGS